MAFEVDLSLKNSAKDLLKYGPQINRLKLQVHYLTDNILRFKIYDPTHRRYEVPIQKNFPLLQQRLAKVDPNSAQYSMHLSDNETDFQLAIERKSTKTKVSVIF